MSDGTIIGVLMVLAGLVWIAIAGSAPEGGVGWGDEPRKYTPRQVVVGTVLGSLAGLVLVAFGVLVILL